MRSRILSLADCGELITGPIIESMPISEIAGNVERDLQSLCMQCKQTNAVSTVSSGDTVLLKLVSNLPKFHRCGLFVVVGANLFDAELEAALVGKTVGSTFPVCIDGETVTVTVEKCLHTVIPEPSDEMIAQLELEGITTLEAYRQQTARQHKEQYREYYLEYLASEYAEQWFDASAWEIDPSELDTFFVAAKRQHDLECEAHDTYFLENYPGQLNEILRNDALRYLQALLVECQLFGGDPKELKPDLEHAYARKAAMERIWNYMAGFISPHFTLIWEEDR